MKAAKHRFPYFPPATKEVGHRLCLVFSTAFVAKPAPLPCVSNAFMAKTLPLPCVSNAFMAKTLPLPCVITPFSWLSQRLRRVCSQAYLYREIYEGHYPSAPAAQLIPAQASVVRRTPHTHTPHLHTRTQTRTPRTHTHTRTCTRTHRHRHSHTTHPAHTRTRTHGQSLQTHCDHMQGADALGSRLRFCCCRRARHQRQSSGTRALNSSR